MSKITINNDANTPEGLSYTATLHDGQPHGTLYTVNGCLVVKVKNYYRDGHLSFIQLAKLSKNNLSASIYENLTTDTFTRAPAGYSVTITQE